MKGFSFSLVLGLGKGSSVVVVVVEIGKAARNGKNYQGGRESWDTVGNIGRNIGNLFYIKLINV